MNALATWLRKVEPPKAHIASHAHVLATKTSAVAPSRLVSLGLGRTPSTRTCYKTHRSSNVWLLSHLAARRPKLFTKPPADSTKNEPPISSMLLVEKLLIIGRGKLIFRSNSLFPSRSSAVKQPFSSEGGRIEVLRSSFQTETKKRGLGCDERPLRSTMMQNMLDLFTWLSGYIAIESSHLVHRNAYHGIVLVLCPQLLAHQENAKRMQKHCQTKRKKQNTRRTSTSTRPVKPLQQNPNNKPQRSQGHPGRASHWAAVASR